MFAWAEWQRKQNKNNQKKRPGEFIFQSLRVQMTRLS
jgi:hypothetical protein